MARAKTWRAWHYDPRPRGWPPSVDPTAGRLTKLRKLAIECRQDEEGVYWLGTTFRMTLTPEGERKLWG